MKKILLPLIVLIVLAGTLLSACTGGASANLVGEWRLVTFGPASSQKPAAGETSVNFGADGRLNGNVGCNSFGGEYKVKDGNIEFDHLFSTMMACEASIDEQERAVFATLTDTTTFNLTGDTMTITSADGSSVMVLARK